MKKMLKLLAVAAMIACGLMMTSCQEGDEIINELAGPTQTWCDMPISYKNSEGGETASLYAYFFYSDTDVTSTSTGGSALKKGTTIPAGLTIVITSANNSNQSSVISGLTSNAYIMKTFPKDQEVSAEEGSDFHVTGSREKWSAIYWMKKELRQADHQNKNPPAQLTNGGNGTNLAWDSIKEQFSWKRLLADYLLNSL